MRTRYIRSSAAVVATTVLLGGCVSDDGTGRRHHHGSNTVSIQSSVLDDHWKSYASHVPRGTTRLEIRLHGLSQDADLFVAGPQRYDTCDSVERGTRADTCVFYHPTPGEWLIDVIGWDYGRTYYTLTTTLSPSHKEATLWKIDAGALSLQSPVTTADSVNADLRAAEALLPMVAAAIRTARDPDTGVGRYALLQGEEEIGQATITVGIEGDRREVHVKAVTRDADTGQRRLVYTRAERPIVLGPHADGPEQGMASLHLDDRMVELRFGMDTGTGAALQLVAEPGPAVRELGWSDMDADSLQLESR